MKEKVFNDNIVQNIWIERQNTGLGPVAHGCNPSYLGG
jgi:hypothetical protein